MNWKAYIVVGCKPEHQEVQQDVDVHSLQWPKVLLNSIEKKLQNHLIVGINFLTMVWIANHAQATFNKRMSNFGQGHLNTDQDEVFYQKTLCIWFTKPENFEHNNICEELIHNFLIWHCVLWYTPTMRRLDSLVRGVQLLTTVNLLS
jgi:hypothetical protein